MTKRKSLTTMELEIKQGIRQNHNRRSSRVPNLPKDIISNILKWGSAKFLHNVGKLVCKSWAKTIYSPLFIDKHLSISNPILFFKYPEDYDPLFYIELQCKRLREFDYADEDGEFEGKLLDSSDGLMLYDDLENEVLFVRNSITNQISKLPYPPLPIMDSICKMNVVYLPLTGEVKVICTDRCHLESTTRFLWSVFTVGTADHNMSWRMMNITTTIQDTSELVFSSAVGVVVIYWTTRELFSHMTFFAVDVYDESFHLVRVPSICGEHIFWRLIPMGRELYVISVKRDWESLFRKGNKLRIWKMRDFRRSEWMEVFAVELVDEEFKWYLMDQSVDVIAWYENLKTLVFIASIDKIMAYNFKTKRSYDIANSDLTLKYFLPHRNSLIRW